MEMKNWDFIRRLTPLIHLSLSVYLAAWKLPGEGVPDFTSATTSVFSTGEAPFLDLSSFFEQELTTTRTASTNNSFLKNTLTSLSRAGQEPSGNTRYLILNESVASR